MLIKNHLNVKIFIFLLIISLILLLLLSPVENKNNKISKLQKKIFKIIVLILTTINVILVIYLINVKENVGYALGCGQLLSTILVVISYLLNLKTILLTRNKVKT